MLIKSLFTHLLSYGGAVWKSQGMQGCREKQEPMKVEVRRKQSENENVRVVIWELVNFM